MRCSLVCRFPELYTYGWRHGDINTQLDLSVSGFIVHASLTFDGFSSFHAEGYSNVYLHRKQM